MNTQLEVEALRARVEKLERFVRPLANLEGIDGELIADQAVVDWLAQGVGSSVRAVASRDRSRETAWARARVAVVLARQAGWSQQRIARNLACTQQAVGKMLARGANEARRGENRRKL
jgi:DNA-directed RNA polymerase specialized sigma24 family protein